MTRLHRQTDAKFVTRQGCKLDWQTFFFVVFFFPPPLCPQLHAAAVFEHAVCLWSCSSGVSRATLSCSRRPSARSSSSPTSSPSLPALTSYTRVPKRSRKGRFVLCHFIREASDKSVSRANNNNMSLEKRRVRRGLSFLSTASRQCQQNVFFEAFFFSICMTMHSIWRWPLLINHDSRPLVTCFLWLLSRLEVSHFH